MLEDDLGLVAGAIEFSDRKAGEVMVAVDRLVTLPVTVTPEELELAVSRTGFSRFPITRDGALAGYLHLKDVLVAPAGHRATPVPSEWVRALADVGPDTEIEATLSAMQRTGAHLARVTEDGEVLGVVFLEDILEELVGEVRDALQRRRSD